MASAIGVKVPTLYTAVFMFGAWLSRMGGALAVPYVGLLTTGWAKRSSLKPLLWLLSED